LEPKSELGDPVWKLMWPSFGNEVRATVMDSIDFSVRNAVWREVGQLRTGVWRSIGDLIREMGR